MRHRVFAYGTLMFPEIATAVIGGHPPREHARLPDHARHALRRHAHPGAVPRDGHAIEGIVYHGLTPAALARIDDFEGNLYRRRRVGVLAGDDGRYCSGFVYLLRPRWHSLLLAHDWSPQTYCRNRLARHLGGCPEEFQQHSPARGLSGLSGGRPR